MEHDRIIRILQRFQKPERELENMPLCELCPYVAGLQKAIDVLERITEQQPELNTLLRNDFEAERRRMGRIFPALLVAGYMSGKESNINSMNPTQ